MAIGHDCIVALHQNLHSLFDCRAVLLGIEQKRSIWIEEEAADMLLGTWMLGPHPQM